MIEELGWEDDFEQHEYDLDDDDDALYMPCPECGREILDDADQCPYCGHYIVYSTSIWADRSPVWIVLGLLGTIAVIFALLAF